MICLGFPVAGRPIPQGSKTARIAGRRIKLGSGETAVVSPRAYMIELGNMAGKGKSTRQSGELDRWRQLVAGAGMRAMFQGSHDKAIKAPFSLACEFVLPRPESHFTKKSRRLTAAAPSFPTLPDISKLVRAVEDALTNIVWTDDGLIVKYGEMSKRYANEPGKVGGVYVYVEQVGEEIIDRTPKRRANPDDQATANRL